MATHSSAIKRHAQSLKRRAINRAHRSRLRTRLKMLRDAAASGDASGARKLLPETIRTIDRAIRWGVLHQNAAARHKSRLTRLVNSLGEPGGARQS